VKVLRLVLLGFAIWSVSLLWPGLNQALTSPAMIGLLLSLSAIALAYILIQHLYHHHDESGTAKDHPSTPIPAVLTR
jgi:hypothetical protein